MASADLSDLLESWTLALKAERKSRETLKSYRAGVKAFLRWCEESGTTPELTKRNFQAFIAYLAEIRESATVVNRHLACRRFSAWLAEEGEIPADPLAGLQSPSLDEKVMMPLTPDELAALIAACKGNDFRARRDDAVVRLMAECGSRASETVSMLLSETNVAAGTTVIRRGKGGKGRIVPFGPFTARSLDRYLRLRRGHRLADTDALWLGDRGKGLGYYGLYSALTERAEAAGLKDFHPHKLRHTFADRWLSAGGSEGGLMAVAGWERPEMLRRYTKGRQAARAMEEARGLNLGDL